VGTLTIHIGTPGDQRIVRRLCFTVAKRSGRVIDVVFAIVGGRGAHAKMSRVLTVVRPLRLAPQEMPFVEFDIRMIHVNLAIHRYQGML
jgi:hypothetical protein